MLLKLSDMYTVLFKGGDIQQDIYTEAYKDIPEDVLSEMQDLGLL